MPRSRVMLANAHLLVLDALENLLKPRFEVIGRITDGRLLIPTACELAPDAVIIDLALPFLDPADVGPRLTAVVGDIAQIVLTSRDSADLAERAVRRGVVCISLEDTSGRELVRAVERAPPEDCPADRSAPAARVETEAQFEAEHSHAHAIRREMLTSRQHEVLALLVAGHTMKEIARKLDIKPRTVAHHKYAMMDNLGIKTSAELIRFALHHGLAHI
ncbi:MAG: response regulator transcription factor [Myxococcota bacterium]